MTRCFRCDQRLPERDKARDEKHRCKHGRWCSTLGEDVVDFQFCEKCVSFKARQLGMFGGAHVVDQ